VTRTPGSIERDLDRLRDRLVDPGTGTGSPIDFEKYPLAAEGIRHILRHRRAVSADRGRPVALDRDIVEAALDSMPEDVRAELNRATAEAEVEAAGVFGDGLTSA
jgi:hypothetical protein